MWRWRCEGDVPEWLLRECACIHVCVLVVNPACPSTCSFLRAPRSVSLSYPFFTFLVPTPNEQKRREGAFSCVEYDDDDLLFDANSPIDRGNRCAGCCLLCPASIRQSARPLRSERQSMMHYSILLHLPQEYISRRKTSQRE